MSKSPRVVGRPNVVGLLAVLAVAAAARIAFVERQGLWADELFSLGLATGHSLEHAAREADPGRGDFIESPRAAPPSTYAAYLAHEHPPAGLERIVRAVALSDTNPPLYYLLLGVWTSALGTSDAALRGFSVLASLLCLPVIWRLARIAGGRAAALPAGLLFALSPPCVFYSTEGRMYALLWLLTAIAALVTLDAARRGLGVGRAVLLAAAGAAGLLTHYFFVFVWAAFIAWLMIHPGRASRRRTAATLALTVLLILPWYLHVPETVTHWRVTRDWLLWRPPDYSPIVAALFLPWSYLSLNVFGGTPTRLNLLAALLFVVLAAWAAARLRRRAFTPRRLLLWLWVAAACAGPIVFDALRGTYTTAVSRYALAGLPAAFVLVGLAVSRLPGAARTAATALVAILYLVGLGRFHATASRNGEPFREIGALLAAETNADDLVIVHSIPSGVAGIARYMERARGGLDPAGFASWVGQLGQRRVPEAVERLAAGRRRIVLVDLHAVGAPAPEKEWLLSAASLRAETVHEAASISTFEPREPGRFFPSVPGANDR